MNFFGRLLPKPDQKTTHLTPSALDAVLEGAAAQTRRVAETSKTLAQALSAAHATALENEIGGAQLTTRGLLAGLTDPVILMDNATYVIEVYNDAAVQAFGYSASEAIGNSLSFLFKEKAFKKIIRSLQKHATPVEVPAKTKTNETVIVEIQASRYENTTVLVFRDLTARRRAEAQGRAAARHRNELQSIVDSLTTVGVFITDPSKPDNPIVFANEGVTALTGYTRKDVLGRNPRFLQGHDVAQPGLQTLRTHLKMHTPGQGIILRNYRKDGSLFYSALSITPIKNAEGGIAHWVGTFSDVTDSQNQNSRVAQLGLYLGQIISKSPVGISLYDCAVRDFIFVNDVGKTLYSSTLSSPLKETLLMERLAAEKTIVEPVVWPLDGVAPLGFVATYCLVDTNIVLSFFVPMQKDNPQENAFAAATQMLALPVILYDATSKEITYANTAAAQMGLDIGKSYTDLVLEEGSSFDALPLSVEGISYVGANLKGVPQLCGKCVITREGKLSIAVFFLAQSTLISTLSQKRTSKHTLDALPIPALVYGEDGLVADANILARTLLGLNTGSRIDYVFDETSLAILRSNAPNYHMPLTLPGGMTADCTVIAAPYAEDGSTLLLLIEGLVPKSDGLTRALHASNDVIAVLSKDLKLVMGNASFFNLYKAKPGDALERFVFLASQKPLPFDVETIKLGSPWSGTLATYTQANDIVTSTTTVVPIVNGSATDVAYVLFIQHKVTRHHDV